MLEKSALHFGRATLLLNDSEFTYALEHYKNKMAANITDFSQTAKDGRELRNDIREKIAHTINDLEDCTASKRKALIAVITDYDKISNASVFDNKKTGPRKPLK